MTSNSAVDQYGRLLCPICRDVGTNVFSPDNNGKADHLHCPSCEGIWTVDYVKGYWAGHNNGRMTEREIDRTADWDKKDPCAHIHEVAQANELDREDWWEDQEFATGLLNDFIKNHCDPAVFHAYLEEEAAVNREQLMLDEAIDDEEMEDEDA